jgi:predicted permease
MDPRAAYGKDPAKYLALYRDLPERLEQLPGVRSASFADASFFGANVSRGNIAYDGYAQEVPPSEYPFKLRISPGFPETFGLSLVAGRTFTNLDNRSAPSVAVVSESIAKRYYPGQEAVAKRFCFSGTFNAACAIEIVGVVKDVRYNSLRQASPFAVYLPVEQEPRVRGDLQVRTLTDPRVMSAQVQEAIRRFNPELRVVHTTTLERLVDDSIVEDRLLSTLSTGFATLALALAAVGLYGITSYGVHRRTNEIGVRMALGASVGDVQWMVLREVLLLATAGAVVGIAAALAASSVVRGLLFGLTPTDPMTVLGATVVLIVVAVLAGYVPARRATRIDPMAALRVE